MLLLGMLGIWDAILLMARKLNHSIIPSRFFCSHGRLDAYHIQPIALIGVGSSRVL
jgi:hypothetical protein